MASKAKAASKQKQSKVRSKNIDKPLAITPIEYGGLQAAFDHFNVVLFEGKLPDVFITYQRMAHSRGYFSENRFAGRVGKLGKHELALNPDAFVERTDEQITSTLVHEMVHLWQHTFGKPPSRGYHNKEWAAKMKAVGLMPSNTGAVGGKETGQQMTHYILPDAAFAQAFANLAATGWKLNLQSAIYAGGGKTSKNKTTFDCLHCGWTYWGKPDSLPICGPCILQAAPPNLHDFLRTFIAPERSAANKDATPVASYEQTTDAPSIVAGHSYDQETTEATD